MIWKANSSVYCLLPYRLPCPFQFLSRHGGFVVVPLGPCAGFKQTSRTELFFFSLSGGISWVFLVMGGLGQWRKSCNNETFHNIPYKFQYIGSPQTFGPADLRRDSRLELQRQSCGQGPASAMAYVVPSQLAPISRLMALVWGNSSDVMKEPKVGFVKVYPQGWNRNWTAYLWCYFTIMSSMSIMYLNSLFPC